MIMKILCFIVVVFGLSAGENIQLEDVIEPCYGVFTTKDYDHWDYQNSTINSLYYLSMTNKYMSVILSLNLFKTFRFESITDAQLNASCLTLQRLKGSVSGKLTGYNNENMILPASPVANPKHFRFNFKYPDPVTGSGLAAIALSDNHSYTLFDLCYDNGARGFLVYSKYKTLDDNTRNIIVAHLKSLGFNEKYFVDYDFNTCTENEDGVPISTMESYPEPFDFKKPAIYSIIHGQQLIVPTYVVG